MTTHEHLMPPTLRILPERLVNNLERARYQYAVRMQNIPHYYTVAKTWADHKDGMSEELMWTVWEMRKHDVMRPFMGREQHYLDVNGFSYWTMVPRDEETMLINRQYCTHGAYDSPFDAMAHQYDDSDRPWRAVKDEREALYAPAAPSGRVLDVGCGTGLLVDYCYLQIDRERYVGIDPSAGMLARFALKHPDYKAEATLLRTTFEDYETPLRFDTIVAMAGSASHVTGVGIVEKARHLLAPGGRAYLMFYRDPAAAFERMGIEMPPLAETPEGAERDGDYVALELARDG
ncbi:MAG: class I SAM-dependent methyltransferase [Chloroflexi bacterium]|nr:class I SAM-dependent methyltransferase [Chloroflexota bacterium]